MSSPKRVTDLTSVPEGAIVRLVFEGALIGGDLDEGTVRLTTSGGDRLKISWSQAADYSEEYAPDAYVLDYGFRPGDVATVTVRDDVPGGQRFETLLAVAPGDPANPVRWMGSDGQFRAVDPANLTLVMRNGLHVPQED